MRDIFATPELKGSTIVLEDIIQERLDLIYSLGQKMIQDFNLDFHLEKTLSLDEALHGKPEKLLFRQIFLDTAQLARILMAMPEVDAVSQQNAVG